MTTYKSKIAYFGTRAMRPAMLLVAAWWLSLVAPGTLAHAEDGPTEDGPTEDWPTYLKDIHRGGVTAEELALPLAEDWVFTTARGPALAWVESPAAHDYLHDHYDLKPRQHFDRCFHVAIVGQRVFFGSSVSGTVTCLDAADGGRELWTFFTDGPVRFAPQVTATGVYVGSDDGFIYCLGPTDGSVVWKQRIAPSPDRCWGNENMISIWPVRTSVLVDGTDVFWSAGLFPREGTFLCKRNAADGSGGWTVTPARPHQGYLVATATHLIAPSGKTSPAVYSRDDGQCAGDLRRRERSGSWVLVTPDEAGVFSGPTLDGKTDQYAASDRKIVASAEGANHLVVDDTGVYFNTDSKIVRLQRSDLSKVWTENHVYPLALIKAGDHLFAGGDGQVVALDSDSGKQLWKASIDGKAFGLAVANGALYVSTDRGSIYCFRTSRFEAVSQTGSHREKRGEVR